MLSGTFSLNLLMKCFCSLNSNMLGYISVKCFCHVLVSLFLMTSIHAQATPHLSTKRKSLHGRKLRPKSVVDSVDGLSADDIPDLLPPLPKSAEGKHVTVCGSAMPGPETVASLSTVFSETVNITLCWDAKSCSVW